MRQAQAAPLHLQRLARLVRAIVQPGPQGLEGLPRLGVQRREVDLSTLQPVQAEVLGSVDAHHLHVHLKLGDERHEELAVEAVLVESVWRAVGGRHDHHALRPHAQDHGVGDVGDVELVEAEQARAPGQVVRHGRDRIVAAAVPAGVRLAEPGLARGRIALAPSGDQGVGLAHEGVEVHAPLAGHRRRLEEEVHDHGLAAPHGAVQVDAAGRLAFPVAQAEGEAGFR